MTDLERSLLASLANAPKRFDIGLCPVPAVAASWELSARGLVRIEECVIAITQAGLDALVDEERGEK